MLTTALILIAIALWTGAMFPLLLAIGILTVLFIDGETKA